jgi:hypothetical protein
MLLGPSNLGLEVFWLGPKVKRVGMCFVLKYPLFGVDCEYLNFFFPSVSTMYVWYLGGYDKITVIHPDFTETTFCSF